MLIETPGWTGAFTTEQAEGALPNGTRIEKTKSEPKDATPGGTPGTILGSISHPGVMNGAIMYFVEWDDRPKVAVGVMGWKLLEN